MKPLILQTGYNSGKLRPGEKPAMMISAPFTLGDPKKSYMAGTLSVTHPASTNTAMYNSPFQDAVDVTFTITVLKNVKFARTVKLQISDLAIGQDITVTVDSAEGRKPEVENITVNVRKP